MPRFTMASDKFGKLVLDTQTGLVTPGTSDLMTKLNKHGNLYKPEHFIWVTRKI